MRSCSVHLEGAQPCACISALGTTELYQRLAHRSIETTSTTSHRVRLHTTCHRRHVRIFSIGRNSRRFSTCILVQNLHSPVTGREVPYEPEKRSPKISNENCSI